MLKFEGIAVGTTIKAYDFQPMKGRTDRYVTGKIVDLGHPIQGSKFYHIVCEEDSSFGPGHNRIGLDIYIPMEMYIDYNERIVPLDGPCAPGK